MIKRGFTLAEILIALALVGIIAALTIPTLLGNVRHQANAAKLSAAITDFENATSVMITQEEIDDLSELENMQGILELLPKYLKVNTTNDDMNGYYGSAEPFTTINEEAGMGDFGSLMLAKNGAVFMFDDNVQTRNEDTVRGMGGTVSSSRGRVAIDVNGTEGPNMYGVDVFLFRLGDNGSLYPFGSLNCSILENDNNTNLWDGDDSDYKCVDDDMTEGCTARLVENNFRVDF